MSQNDSHEPVTVTDKRRIDPDTGEIREQPRPGRPPVGRRRRSSRAESQKRPERPPNC